MHRIVFLFLILCFLLPIGHAKGFRILGDGDAQVRNRSAMLGGRTVVRIRCATGATREAGYPYLFIIRRNGDAYRVVNQVIIRVDNAVAEVFNDFAYEGDNEGVREALRNRGDSGLVLASVPIVASVDFTEIMGAFSADGVATGKLENIVNAMKNGGQSLQVEVLTSDNKLRKTTFDIAGTFQYALDNVCNEGSIHPSDLN